MKWQDGEPFTAKDVAFTFNYVIENEMGSYMGYTKGITKVVATDDYTVVFTCEKPKATMLQMWVPILPEHIWSKVSPKTPPTSSRTCRRASAPAPSRWSTGSRACSCA